MISKKFNDWLQIVGLFGVLGGLIFVGLQLSLDRGVAISDRTIARTANRAYWAELLTNNADVWIRGLADDPLSATEAAQFAALADARLSLYFTSNVQGRYGLGVAPRFSAVRAARLIYENPGLQSWWSEDRARSIEARQIVGISDSDWGTAVDEELDRLAPPEQ